MLNLASSALIELIQGVQIKPKRNAPFANEVG